MILRWPRDVLGTRRTHHLTIPSTALSVALGLAFLMSNHQRLSSESYAAIMATGGSPVWGVIFLFVGMLVALSCLTLRQLQFAFVVSALAYGALTLAFTVAAARFADANLTAPVVYGWVCWIHLIFAYRVHGRIAEVAREGLEPTPTTF